jgi:hypothetical protein
MTAPSTRSGGGFEAAIERKQWEVVCLYLMLGVTEAASKLPPESLSALLDLLAGEEEGQGRRRSGG